MAYSSFEDLEVWRRSKQLACDVLRMTSSCQPFALRDQIIRSAISIPSNIAEGAERGTTPEFIRFLNIAKGSAAELRTQISIAADLGLSFCDGKDKAILSELKELSKMLHGLIKSMKP